MANPHSLPLRRASRKMQLFWRLHELKGDFRDHWAVAVRANWRIIFRFEDGDAFDVDLVDTH